MANIPSNDSMTPRWLLDIHEWKVVPFKDVSRSILEREGDCIVSYTWGYIADYVTLTTGTPEGIQWDVPGTKKWPLSKTRDVMNTISTRYMWWDWMCVPQGGRESMRELSPELERVKGEEIGKQMHIYRSAKKSIVWLHSTFWKDESALKALLLKRPRESNPLPNTTLELVKEVEGQIRAAQEAEYWFCSGWTLQEGVLLGPTHLVDADGGKLEHESFFHGGYASVLDSTTTITLLAISIAQGFYIHAEGGNTDDGSVPGGLAKQLDDPALATEPRKSLKTLIYSGLVGYTEFFPLYILAEKQSRKFGVPQDCCFALLGAMGLDGIPAEYSTPIHQIKRLFLAAMIERYQWTMLLLPLPDDNLIKELQEQQIVPRNFQWLDIVDGVLLPIGVFIDTQIKPKVPSTKPTPLKNPENDQEKSDQLNLPILTYENTLLIKPRKGQTLTLGEIIWFRHYRQSEDGLRIVSPKEIAAAEGKDNLMDVAWFLPLEDLETRDNVVGKRCLALLRFNSHPPDTDLAYGDFGGIADIWISKTNTVEVQEITVNASL
ncbi:Heterokaryon incompatibility protein [Rutstroemia sp. NJR-2017a WRK4]|nr:Heterokaryon incompatibility protein [Rutstroemia sp. NJR-2017a WRK4]